MVCKYYFLWESKTRQKFPSLLLCPDLLCSSSDISAIFFFKKAFSFIWFFILILQLSQVEYTFVKWTGLAKIGKNLQLDGLHVSWEWKSGAKAKKKVISLNWNHFYVPNSPFSWAGELPLPTFAPALMSGSSLSLLPPISRTKKAKTVLNMRLWINCPTPSQWWWTVKLFMF